MASRPPCPPGTPWISPYLCVKDADAAIEFYQRAFGFTLKMAMKMPDGRTGHVEMAWRDSLLMFGPEQGSKEAQRSPATSGVPSAVQLYAYCDDVDAWFARAKAAGAEVLAPPETMFWGDRICKVYDRDKYLWIFATNVADFDPSKAPG